MTFDFERHLREARIIMGIAFIGALTYQLFTLPDRIAAYTASQVVTAHARAKPILDNIQGISTIGNSFIHELSNDYYDPKNDTQGFYWDIKNVTNRSSESSTATARLIARLDAQLNGGADPLTGLTVAGAIPTASMLLASLNATVLAGKDSLAKLDRSLEPLQTVLGHIAGLSAELEAEMVKGGNVDKTFASLSNAVSDFDVLIDSPSIQQILANTASTTKSLAGSADTLDIVMRPWRKKANQLKVILGKLAGMLKVVVPLPF